MPSGFRQDMPPEGGYAPLQWARQKAGKTLSSAKTVGALACMMTVGFIQCKYMYNQRRLQRLEQVESYLCLEPFCRAERERRQLKWLGRLRAEEADVMKNVPFWEVGKWYNRPVFHNQANRWTPLFLYDVYPHCSKYAADLRYHERYWGIPSHRKNNAKWDRE